VIEQFVGRKDDEAGRAPRDQLLHTLIAPHVVKKYDQPLAVRRLDKLGVQITCVMRDSVGALPKFEEKAAQDLRDISVAVREVRVIQVLVQRSIRVVRLD